MSIKKGKRRKIKLKNPELTKTQIPQSQTISYPFFNQTQGKILMQKSAQPCVVWIPQQEGKRKRLRKGKKSLKSYSKRSKLKSFLNANITKRKRQQNKQLRNSLREGRKLRQRKMQQLMVKNRCDVGPFKMRQKRKSRKCLRLEQTFS